MSILHRFRDIVTYFPKFKEVTWPRTHPFRRLLLNINQKTRVPGLSYGVVCVILGLAVLVELRLVTDGWTDTRRRRIPR